MNKKTAMISVILAILLAFIFLFLCLGASCTAHRHECIGDNCKVCAAVSFLRDMFVGTLMAGFMSAIPHVKECFLVGISRLYPAFAGGTPVSLKVKISC